MTFTTWEVAHRYQRLVRRGIAEPLMCHSCRVEYIKKINSNTEPIYYCLRCRGTMTPGAKLLEQMRETVTQYFSEEE